MNSEVLNKLVEYGDISPGFLDYNEGLGWLRTTEHIFSKDYFISSHGLIHFLSLDIIIVFGELLNEHLDNLYCVEFINQYFKPVVEDRLKYCPPSREKQIERLELIIAEKCEEKDQLRLDESYKEIFGDSYINTSVAIISDTEKKWYKQLVEHCEVVLNVLKCEFFSESKIQFSAVKNLREIAEELYYLAELRFANIFENIIVIKKIDYLQEQLELINTDHFKTGSFKICKNVKGQEEYSHRQKMFAYHFKHLVNGDKYPYKSGADWKRDIGGRAAQEFSTTDINNKTKYKPPTQKELQKIIVLLAEDKEAQRIAISKQWS